MTFRTHVTTFILALFTAVPASAQTEQSGWCSNHSGIPPALLRNAHLDHADRGGVRYVKVKMYIGSQPGPGGDACTMSEVQRDLDGLNHVFAHNNTGIQFVLCGPVQILEGWEFYDLWNFDPAAMNPYFEPGYLTFLFSNILPNSLGGFTFGDMIFLSGRGSVDIMAHEVAHTLGLLHTHDDMLGAELVDGSNCATAGDFVCDTPAEPDLSQPGIVEAYGCTYTGTVTDANGDTYAPMPRNIMSYAPCVRDTLTPGQGQLMRYVLDNVKSYLHSTLQPVIIEQFETRQCHNSGALTLNATPSPGTLSGPLVDGNTIVNAPNPAGQYHVEYATATLNEDSATFVDQFVLIYDQYEYYQHGSAQVDSATQVVRGGIDGRLTAVDLLIHDEEPNDYRLRIYDTGSTLLYETLLASPAIPDTTWISFPIDITLPTLANGTYTLEITATDTFQLMTSYGTNWAYLDYTRGNSSFGAYRDAIFRTWVHALPPCQNAIRYYEIYQPPTYNITNLADTYCPTFNETVVMLGASAGATNSSLWVDGVATGEFIPSALGEGEHLVEYINTTYGCTDTTELFFSVAEPPLTITDLGSSVCADADVITLVGEPAGGMITIDGVETDQLDPVALGIGPHIASYTAMVPLDSVAFRDQWCCGLSSYPYFATVAVPAEGTFWQSFTPAYSGTLDSVRVSLSTNLQSFAYAVQLLQGEGIGGTVLDTDTFSIGISNSYPNLSGDMHPQVLGGQTYTLVVERLPDAIGTNPILFYFGNNSYTAGTGDIFGIADPDIYFEQYISRVYGCEGSIDVPFTVEVCTGVTDPEVVGFSIAPNPFTNSFVLRSEMDAEYTVYSSLGELVTTGRVNARTQEMVSTETMAPGIYTVRCTNLDDGTVSNAVLVKE